MEHSCHGASRNRSKIHSGVTMATLLIILYLLNGRAYLVQSVHASQEACMEAGAAQLEKINDQADIIVAGCAEVDAQEVKK